MLALRSFLAFLMRTAPVWLPMVLAGVLVWYVQGLRTELSQTQQELHALQQQAVTDDALQAVRDKITAANITLERSINEQDKRVAQSLTEIRSKVEETGTDVEKLQMQLQPDVAKEIDREICKRGYRDCKP